MEKDGLRRRQFLRTSGIAVTALATGGSIIFGPNHAWAWRRPISTRIPLGPFW
jgi:hypothetical protein